MKIVITVASYWPKTDGVQMVTQYQAEALCKMGDDVTVITSIAQGLKSLESHNGVRIFRVNASNFYYWHKGDKRSFRNLVYKLTEDADALVAVCLQSYAADWLLGVIEAIPCKKVLYLHGMPDFKLHKSDWRTFRNGVKTIVRNVRWGLFYRIHWNKIIKFDTVIHLMQYDNSYTYFQNHGYKKNIVIENACEDLFFEEDDKSVSVQGLPEQYFLYVGNYCARKNQQLALEAFYQMEHKAAFIFIGSRANRYMSRLSETNKIFSQRYGKRDVRILCNVPRTQIAYYTKRCSACVMTSCNEFYPITIIEAMAAKKPCLSTDVGIVKYLPGVIIANSKRELVYWLDFFCKEKEVAAYIGECGNLFAKRNLTIKSKAVTLRDCLARR